MGSPGVDSAEVAEVVVTERLAVGGMTCGACARHVEAALGAVPGVHSVQVDLASATATVSRDPQLASSERLRLAVVEAGYALQSTEGRAIADRATIRSRLPARPLAFGLIAAVGLLAFYLGVITLAQGWGHAVQQLFEDRFFVGAISLGFGTQVGLFTHLRGLHARASTGGVAASTGTSTTAMLACCAHHLTEILPILGLSGAAVFLNAYKTPLLWVGIGMNLVGIAYLTWQIRKRGSAGCLVPGVEHNVER